MEGRAAGAWRGLPVVFPEVRLVRAILVSLALAAAPAAAYDGASSAARADTPRIESMNAASPGSTRVDDAGVSLEADFASPSPGTLTVRYRLHNTGDAPLAVFDRGNRQAVLAKRQAPGAVGAPTFEDTGNGDVVLRHVALPAAGTGPTGPTLPATPLALKLAPGATLAGGFTFSIPAAPPRRVRWCLGVAAFNDGDFFSPEHTGDGEVWQANDDAVRTQRTLCTPWFEVAANRFAEG